MESGVVDRDGETDLYRVLGVQRNATQEQIRRAYHQALLRHHPDKKSSAEQAHGPSTPIDTVLHAFRILSNESLRQSYDQTLQSANATQLKAGPRPAHIVSLDDFLEDKTDAALQWTYSCRCGGVFVLTEDLLEKDVHLIGCDACSETLWVGYEILDDNAA